MNLLSVCLTTLLLLQSCTVLYYIYTVPILYVAFSFLPTVTTVLRCN